uniref:Transcription regulatory factor FLO8p n=1 Tax=Ganoderma boninense TaxID=34458 RepID=A0A5K1JYI2_9APHY|nr:Transcription regulatory factor FLO8p [Ganoderma boninense]
MSPSAFLAWHVPGPEAINKKHTIFEKPTSLEGISSGRQLAAIFKRSVESIFNLIPESGPQVIDVGAYKPASDSYGLTGTVVELGFAFKPESPLEQSPQSAADPPRGHHGIAVPIEISYTIPLCDMDPGNLPCLQRDVLLSQHRLFLYRILVQRDMARLVYLDHAGIRISDEFNWTVANSFLHVFVWKLAHMTPEELGLDPTAKPATTADVGALRRALDSDSERKRLPPHVWEAARAAFEGDYPVYRVLVTVSDPLLDEGFPADPPVLLPPTNVPLARHGRAVIPEPGEERVFLVGRPHFQAERHDASAF